MAELGKLTRLQVEGFKSIRSLDLELRDLNILIGPNGAGKSNFVSAFRFLNKLAQKDLKHYVNKQGGADRFLHFGQKVTDKLRINLRFPPNDYQCILSPSIDGSFLFEKEFTRFYGPDLGYEGGVKTSDLAPKKAEESGLPHAVIAKFRARRGQKDWAAVHMSSWIVYHFHDVGSTAKVKGIGKTNDRASLNDDGGNLAAFLRFLRMFKINSYQEIVQTITRAAPFFHDFILEPEPENNDFIRLRWKHVGTDAYFDAHDLSDGTLRFICLATVLLQPNPPTTILLDEPELGLHPYAVELLAGMMRSAAARTQVIAATQSVTLANQFGPEDLIVVDRVDNASVFRRLKEDEVADWLDQYRMGDLWQKNLIGGTP